MREKRAYHHGDLRQALVDAAVAIIEKKGPVALTLREVARRVGVSQAAPYHHFPNKDAILAAVAEEGFVKLAAAMDDARAAAGSAARARLRAIGIGYVRFAVRHPSHFRVMFAGTVAIAEYPTLFEAAQRSFGILIDSVLMAQTANVLPEGPPVEPAVLSWSMMHGLAMLHVNGIMEKPGGPVGSIDHLAEAGAEAIVRGLEIPPAPS